MEKHHYRVEERIDNLRSIKPRPEKRFWEQIQWVKTRNLGVTLETRLSWSPHIDRSEMKLPKEWVCWTPS